MKSERYSTLTLREKRLVTLALVGCIGTLLPLPLLFFDLWPMQFSVPFLVPPSLALMLALAIYARNVYVPTFWARYGAGFMGGLVATVVYDLVRVFGLLTKFPGFAVIHKFGILITGSSELTLTAGAMGWMYHFMNCVVFCIMYALVVCRRSNILWGTLWGLLLEVGMIATYPRTFGISMSWGTSALTFSILGHIGYGATLGILVKRMVNSWGEGGMR